MTSYAAAQKAAAAYASRRARATLKAQGAAETGYGSTSGPKPLTTASTKVKSATVSTIRSAKRRLRRIKLRV